MTDSTAKPQRRMRPQANPTVRAIIGWREFTLADIDEARDGLSRGLYLELLLQQVRQANGGRLPNLSRALDLPEEHLMTG